jgi:hypothetical protein
MENTENKGFNFALPFDPFRLLLAILERFGLILIVGVLCAGLGIAVAIFKLGDSYTASLELVTESWQSNRTGDSSAYIPTPITSEAVMIAAKAEEVYKLAARRISPDLPGKALRPQVVLEQLPGEGIFSASAKTGDGREPTLAIVTAYAEALMEYTAQLRRHDARVQYELLEKQLKNKIGVAKGIDQKIIDYAEQEGVVDLRATSGAAVAELALLKKSLSEAERDLKTNNDLVIGYIRQELVAPLTQQLSDLLTTKSEGHSLVLGKRQEIRAIEQQIERSSAAGSIDLKDYEELLPSNIYQAVQRLKEDRKVLENKVANYKERLAQSESEMGGLPERSLTLGEMVKVRDQAVASSVALRGLMNDAEFFANEAPPALSIFHLPTLSEVRHKSVLFKASVLGLLGLIGGAGAVIGWSLLSELLGRKVRTPMQAAIAAGAYPKLVFPPSRKTTNEIALRNFWIRGIAKFLPAERRFIFPVVGDLPDEAGFWRGLFESLNGEDQRVVFVDFSMEPLDLELPQYAGATPAPVSQIDPKQYPTADFKKLVSSFPEGHALIIRWHMSPTSMLTELAPHIDRQYLLTSQEVSLSTVEEESRSYRDIFGAADGLVLINSKRPMRSMMIVNRLEDWYLEGYRRNALRPSPVPLSH